MYDNQKATAEEIVKSFNDEKRIILLLALTQSGKTDCFLWAGYQMLLQGRIDKIIVMVGSDSTDLYNQYCFSHVELAANFKRHYNKDVLGEVRILKSSDLKMEKHDPVRNKTLVIWDECHHAEAIDNRPIKFLDDNEFAYERKGMFDLTNWSAKQCFLLLVSATPFNQRGVKLYKLVRHMPGENYKGVKWYRDQDLLFSSWQIQDENDIRFNKLLKEFKAKNEYFIVRSRNEHIESYCNNHGIKYMKYTGEQKDIKNLNDLQKAPSRATLIHIHGLCRMGQRLCKSHIGFVFEESQSGDNHACILQGLFGRMTGYDVTKQIQIYIVENYFKKKDNNGKSNLDKYIDDMYGAKRIRKKQERKRNEYAITDFIDLRITNTLEYEPSNQFIDEPAIGNTVPQTTEPQTTEPQTTEPQTTEPQTTVKFDVAQEINSNSQSPIFVLRNISQDCDKTKNTDFYKEQWNYTRVKPYSFDGFGGKWWIQYKKSEIVPIFNRIREFISKKLDIKKNKKGSSKAACVFLDTLSTSIDTYVRHQLNNIDGEYKITGTQKRADGYIEIYKQFHNIIVEYHGCYWHGCTRCHPNKIIRSHSSIDLYKRTLERTDFLRAKGYIVVEIWECDAKRIQNFVEWFENSLENKIEIKPKIVKTSFHELLNSIISDINFINNDLLSIQLQLNTLLDEVVRTLLTS